MADTTLWIGVLTAGTAVIASWVTSWGTARAARIQADAGARSQRAVRIRETRRAAYVDLIEQAHRIAELYWRVTELHRSGAHEENVVAFKELRSSLRKEYGQLRNLVWIVTLEGPDSVARAAEQMRLATQPRFRALGALIEGRPDAARDFDALEDPYWKTIHDFVAAAKAAVHDM
ncbi:hypothetical protein [Streptomyces mutabilis]|uniref:hypothetical protein n=1 Tax=Streptomyces mutabilis TaxID=67332 RepID=UPI00341F5312